MNTQPYPDDETARLLDDLAQTQPLDPVESPAATIAPPVAPTAPLAPYPVAETAPLPAPRVRWAGIVWGLILAAAAAAGLWVLVDPGRRAAISDGVLTLDPTQVNPGTAVGFALLAVGVIVLICGGLALIRRMQRRATA